jgi:hypothetical protein
MVLQHANAIDRELNVSVQIAKCGLSSVRHPRGVSEGAHLVVSVPCTSSCAQL